MSATLLCDQYGRGVSSATLYRTPSQVSGSYLPIARPRAKTYEAVSAWQRREMVDISRVIAAGVPNMDAALLQASEFSIADSWHIKSRGQDKAWGKKRDTWFNQFYSRDCNLRGPQSDWRSTLRQLNWTRKVEGDYAIVFDGRSARDPVSGKFRLGSGKFQVIKFDRIATGISKPNPNGNGNGKGVVSVGNGLDKVKEVGRGNDYYGWGTNPGWGTTSGVFIINDPASWADGLRIVDGVIVDSNLTVLGYRITGFNEAGEPTYADVPKSQIHFNFSARRQVDLLRGIPEIAEAIIPIMGLDDIQYLITMAVKLGSMLAIARESTDGNPNKGGRSNYDEDGVDLNGTAVTVRRGYEELFPGLYELAVNNKEKLTTLDFDRPTMNEEAFIERIETSVLHKFWPRCLIYAESTGRAGTRAIGLQANTICWWDQSCLERDARWIADRATEFAMRAGYIPVNDNLYEPYEYVFTVPGKFTVDEGNDAKARLLALGRCCISHGIICEMDGYLKEEIREERSEEIRWILQESKTIATENPDFDVKSIALMFDAGESNVSFTEQAEQEEDSPESRVPSPQSGAGAGTE